MLALTRSKFFETACWHLTLFGHQCWIHFLCLIRHKFGGTWMSTRGMPRMVRPYFESVSTANSEPLIGFLTKEPRWTSWCLLLKPGSAFGGWFFGWCVFGRWKFRCLSEKIGFDVRIFGRFTCCSLSVFSIFLASCARFSQVLGDAFGICARFWTHRDLCWRASAWRHPDAAETRSQIVLSSTLTEFGQFSIWSAVPSWISKSTSAIEVVPRCNKLLIQIEFNPFFTVLWF